MTPSSHRYPWSIRLAALSGLLAGGVACGVLPDRGDPPTPMRDAEDGAREALERARVSVTGVVLDPAGTPVAGAEVQIDGAVTTTGADGRYTLDGLWRRNAMLGVTAPGHRPWAGGVFLVQPASVSTVRLDPVVLVADDPAVVRFAMGGDMALGRRYLDPDESTPRDRMPAEDPDAVLRASTIEDDSVGVVDGVLPYFEAADFRIVNLETPVLDAPATPHLTKDYAFFTLPGSLAALHHLGVGYVSLGNNHVYDYLGAGLDDTLRHLDAASVGHSGAGQTPDAAFVPHREQVGGQDWSFLSMSTIHGEGRVTPLFVATDDQGGAADGRDSDRVRATMRGELADERHVGVLLHAGNEYTRAPNDYMYSRLELAAEEGAAFVVAHHPHTIQGFGRHGGMFAAYSLGNFAFDQDRLETLSAYSLYLDVGDGDVVGAHVLPHVVDDYRTRPAVGELADRIVREAGEFSQRDTLQVLWMGGRGQVSEDASARRTRTRTVDVPVTFGEDDLAYVDLRGLRQPGESLARIDSPAEVRQAWLGADLLRFGSFEDEDVDGDWLETSRWYHGASAGPCVTGAFRGTQGMCAWRTSANQQTSVVAFRNRIRVLGDPENTPNRDLTFFGMVRGDNAGSVQLYARYYASFGDKTFGDQNLSYTDVGGTFDWTQVVVPLQMPLGDETTADPASDAARAVRIFLAVGPPEDGEGRLAMDDLAVVNWYQGPFEAGGPVDLQTPHAADFVRLSGFAGTSTVQLTFAREVPVVLPNE